MESILTLLIIDDNPLELGLIKLVIQKNFQNIRVISLTKPPIWKDFFENQKIDIIIIDYRLPEKNGLEQIKELRNYNKEIPAFLITALERDEIDQDIVRFGTTDIIVKDRSYTNLVSKLNDIILKRSFKRFEMEINTLKSIITEFGSFLILKIDKQYKCLETIGNKKSLGIPDSYSFNDINWKEFFSSHFLKLINEGVNNQSTKYIKHISFQTPGGILNFKLTLFPTEHFYYLILQP